MYIYFSGDIHAYMDVWRGDLLLGSGTELSDIQSITGLRFMIDMAESLKLNIINPADKAMVDLINHLRYEMISYASSFVQPTVLSVVGRFTYHHQMAYG
ncbi:hypothetical protein A8M56_08700 [Yersinia pestis]|nr:hypothetical protein A8M56_08700 [Yersinia pestis]